MNVPSDITSKEKAISTFRDLVGQYGLQWSATVPAAAYDLLRACNRFLDERDRRTALGLRT